MTSSNTPLRSSVKVLNLFVTSLYSRSSEDSLGPLVLIDRYKKQIEKHNNSFITMHTVIRGLIYTSPKRLKFLRAKI